jgi:hypothetical protein
MTFEERMKRNSIDDQIEIGQAVDDATSGNFGSILRLIINGMVAENLALNYDGGKVNPDRILGRIEELARLQERLDQCVEIKNQLMKISKDERVVSSAV